MNKVLLLLIVGFSAMTIAAEPKAPRKPSSLNCLDAIKNELQNQRGADQVKLEATYFTPVGYEQVIEVSAMVVAARSKSDTNSTFYYMVSATCAPNNGILTNDLTKMSLVTDMPGEGGVSIKTITKARH